MALLCWIYNSVTWRHKNLIFFLSLPIPENCFLHFYNLTWTYKKTTDLPWKTEYIIMYNGKEQLKAGFVMAAYSASLQVLKETSSAAIFHAILQK